MRYEKLLPILKKSKRRGRRVRHRKRPVHDARHPVLVELKICPEVGGLRTEERLEAIQSALVLGCNRFGMRVNDYSVQDWRIYFVVEADDARALTRGMQGLSIRIARGINRVSNRKGKVFLERYSARPLKTVPAVRGAIRYIHWELQRRRGEHPWYVDPYTSALGAAQCWGDFMIIVEPRTLLLIAAKDRRRSQGWAAPIIS